MSEYKD